MSSDDSIMTRPEEESRLATVDNDRGLTTHLLGTGSSEDAEITSTIETPEKVSQAMKDIAGQDQCVHGAGEGHSTVDYVSSTTHFHQRLVSTPVIYLPYYFLQSRPAILIERRATILCLANHWMKFKMLSTPDRFLDFVAFQ